jgi:hypothetical protein
MKQKTLDYLKQMSKKHKIQISPIPIPDGMPKSLIGMQMLTQTMKENPTLPIVMYQTEMNQMNHYQMQILKSRKTPNPIQWNLDVKITKNSAEENASTLDQIQRTVENAEYRAQADAWLNALKARASDGQTASKDSDPEEEPREIAATYAQTKEQ